MLEKTDYEGQLIEKLTAIGVEEKEVKHSLQTCEGQVYSRVFTPMHDSHRRDRGALVALLAMLTAIVFVAWFSNPANTQIGQPATEQSSAENGKSRPVETVHWGLFSTKDTYAQWLMAMFSVVATGVSIWAVRLLRDTLAATREAVRAADDAVKVTREIGQAQVRAYVLPAHSFIEFPEDNDPVVHLAIRNFGQTPAYELRSWIHIWIENFPLTVELPEAPATFVMAQSVLGAGFHHDFEHKRGVPLNDWSLKTLEEETAAIYIYGKITYVDCFGEPHVSKYRLLFRGKIPADRNSRLMHYMSGNESD